MDAYLTRERPAVRILEPARNRVLATLSREDRAWLHQRMEPVELRLQVELITARRPIPYAYFPVSGIVSTVAVADEARIEIGLVGREGMVGLPAVLGADHTPHTSVVQVEGDALRIAMPVLLEILRERPSFFAPFGLFAQALIVQVGQTAYANAHLNIEARLARWFLMVHDRVQGDEVTLTHEFLAMMLGVRRPGVTTAIHVLEGIGAIRATRGHVLVRNRETLMDLAGDSYGIAEAEYDRLLPAT